jgi:hypothetical protein
MFPGLSSMPNAPITATAQQPVASSRAEIEAFLGQVKALDPSIAASERGRLIFALDATMSRQPTWDQACHLQAEMFREAAAVGGLDFTEPPPIVALACARC